MKAFIITIALCLGVVFSASAEFSADMVTEITGNKDRGRIYFKNSDTSRTEIMGIINISRRPLVYQLFKDTKKYCVTDISQEDKKNTMADVRTIEEWIKKNELKKIGTEKIAGYNCTIYQGDVKYTEDQPAYPTKIWHSKELEYPVKTESTLPEPMGKVLNYLENIKLGKQPASLFDIPSNYTKADTIQEAMGMMNINAPFLKQGSTENSQQKMPSMEDTEKVMKQMQEMQKKIEQNKQQ